MALKKPSYTQIPNDFIDNYLSKLSGKAISVFLFICRKTIGWHKDCDIISQSQLLKFTSIKSVNTLKKVIQELIDIDLIKVNREGIGKGIKTTFEINFILENNISKIDTKDDSNISKIDTKDDSNISNFDTTKENNINKINKKKKYAEFISLREDEYNKLINKYGKEQTIRLIEKLDNYKGSKGKKYKSDYRAILTWVVDACKVKELDKKNICPKCGVANFNGSICIKCHYIYNPRGDDE